MNAQTYKMLIVHSAHEVFDKMMSVPVEEQEQGECLTEGERHLTGTIGFAGQWDGFVSMQCGEQLAKYLTAKMLYADMDTLEEEEVRDALGEIVNMVGGKFKSTFAENYNNGMEAFKMSVPSIVQGKNYEVFAIGSDEVQQIHFKTDGMYFCIDLALKKTA